LKRNSQLTNDRSAKSRLSLGTSVLSSCGCCELSCQQHNAEIIQRYKLPAKRACFYKRSMLVAMQRTRVSRIYFAYYASIHLFSDRAYWL